MKNIVLILALLAAMQSAQQSRVHAYGDALNRQTRVVGSAVPVSATAAPLSGHHPFVSIACRFADIAARPNSLSFFRQMYSANYPGLDDYWREVSNGHIDITGSTAFGWYTLPHDLGYYVTSADHLYTIAKDCTDLADGAIDYNQFDGINIMLNTDVDGFAYGGGIYMRLDGTLKDWRMTWEPPWSYQNITTIAHEMGHAFGLQHSLYRGYEYGNQFDVMSDMWTGCDNATDAIYGCLGQSVIAYDKNYLGWMDGRTISIARPRTVVAIERTELPPATGYLMGIVSIDETHYFTIETRKQAGYDKKLPLDAVVIHVIDTATEYPFFVKALRLGETWTSKGGVTFYVRSETATGFVIVISQ